MNNSDKEKNEKKSIIEGISLGTAFLLVSGFLYVYPDLLFKEVISYSTGAVLGIIGILGILVEIGKLDDEYDEVTKHIGVGFLIGIIGYLLFYFVSNIIINFVVLFLALISIYSFLIGILRVVEIIINQQTVKKSLVKLSVFILNLLIFILTVLQLLQIAKIIK